MILPHARCLCAPGRVAGPAGCALGAPSLFFDLVLLLSHRLDMVCEHCSSPNFSKKKEKDKSNNKTRQNFGTMKFSKIKFLMLKK